MTKSLDDKLRKLRTAGDCAEFILADAKDADMAFGLTAPGYHVQNVRDTKRQPPRLRSLEEYREQICQVVRQGLVDLMLMSQSTADKLAREQHLFQDSLVTPAIRANDSTDIWLAGTGAQYDRQPSLPFRTASIDHAIGQAHDTAGATCDVRIDLGLYSITLNNDARRDHATLSAYREFWLEAEAKGFRHFLEVFPPNVECGLASADVPRFVNNSIARTLAGMPRSCRPVFLKVPYFSPAAMEELVAYDSELIVGIMGGSAGTTRDAFQMLADARRYGARAALFGRKINQAECQLAFVQHLRYVADDQMEPEDAVRSYHDHLKQQGLTPRRSLVDDLARTDNAHRYAQ